MSCQQRESTDSGHQKAVVLKPNNDKMLAAEICQMVRVREGVVSKLA